MKRMLPSSVLLFAMLLAACGEDSAPSPSDAGTDAGAQADVPNATGQPDGAGDVPAVPGAEVGGLPTGPAPDAGRAGCAVKCAEGVVLRSDGLLVAGANSVLTTIDGQPFLAEGGRDLAAGSDPSGTLTGNACVVRQDGTVWCWGSNLFGAIGAGLAQPAAPDPRQVLTSALTPLTNVRRVSADHSGHTFCAIVETGNVWCWGSGGLGPLGHAPIAVQVLTAPGGPPLSGITDISGAQFGACAINAAGAPVCWGLSSGGVPVEVPFLEKVNQVVCSAEGCCAIGAPGGRMWCWGASFKDARQMALADGVPLVDVVGLSRGLFHVLGLRSDKTMVQLQNPAAPLLVAMDGAAPLTDPLLLGEQCVITKAGKIYRRLPSNDLSLYCGPVSPPDRGATRCGAAGEVCCAEEVCGSGLGCHEGKCSCGVPGTPCCGGATCGQQLQCSQANPHCSCVNTCGGGYVLRNDGLVVWKGNNILKGADGQPFKAVDAQDMTGSERDPLIGGTGCVVLKDGSVWCWGDNTFGQLGAGIADAKSATPRQVIGANQTPLLNVRKVSASRSANTVCAVREDGGVWCWGAASVGLLGPGVTTNSNVAQQVLTAPGGAPVTQASNVSLGDQSACALGSDGSVSCWGGFVGKIASPEAAKAVACSIHPNASGGRCCALGQVDSSVWCWSGGGEVRKVIHPGGPPVTGVTSLTPSGNDILLVRDGILYSVNGSLETRPVQTGNDGALMAPPVLGEHCFVTREGQHHFSTTSWKPFCQ